LGGGSGVGGGVASGVTVADSRLLEALASQAALAFENAALLREQKARLKRMLLAERLATAGELAAGAAHEIRNPLTGIRSAIQYVRADYAVGSDRAELMDEVLAEVDRIDQIVEGLLSFARREEPVFGTVDLAELIRHSMAFMAVRAREQHIELRLDLPAELPIRGDAGMLKQVVLNILLNALQAMPAGGRLNVDAAARGRNVEVRIADSGAGIAPEHLERIFDPFFTTRKDGTGLGLSICYGIVERHGGQLEVDSSPGRGTTMIIRLPARPS
jgi:two-component system, NtrC family, sensor kinase